MEVIRYIDSLKNKYVGQDIWILGSGASMNYVDASFFDNKITLGLNRVGVKYKLTYAVLKDLVKNGAREIKNCDSPPFNSEYVVASTWDKAHRDNLNTDPNLNKLYARYPEKFYFFKHNRFKDYTVVRPDTDKLFVSSSTMTSAVHLGAYMGAKNIIICGHDLLTIDGKLYFDGYHKQTTKHNQNFMMGRGFHTETMKLRDVIKKQYGCNIHTLNPFIGFNLEGHVYEKLK